MIQIEEIVYLMSLLAVWGRKSLGGEGVPSWRESLGGNRNHGEQLSNADSEPEGVMGMMWQRGQLSIAHCWGILWCFFTCSL